MARWLEILSSFDFTIEHRAGRNHGNADALSRNPCHQCGFGVQSDTDELLHSEDYKQQAKEILNTRLPTTQIVRQFSVSTPAPTTTDSPTCWLTGWTIAQFSATHREDPLIQIFLRLKESNGDRPTWTEISQEGLEYKALWYQWGRLEVHQGVLHRRWVQEAHDTTQLQLILPKNMNTDVLKQLHDAPTAGHLGVNRTWQAIVTVFLVPDETRY